MLPFMVKQNLSPKVIAQEVTSQDESFVLDISSYIQKGLNLGYCTFTTV